MVATWNCDPYGNHIFDPEKIYFHLEKFTSALNGEDVMPIVFCISPSEICNQRCEYCVSEGFRRSKRSRLSVKILERTIKEISLLGSKSIVFTGGGEPLMNRNTIEALLLAKRLGLEAGLISNGILIKENQIVSLLNSCTFIRISIDTMIQDNYISKRGASPSQFRKLVRNIELLMAAKSELKSSTLVGSQIVWNSQTREEIDWSINALKGLHIDYVQIRPVDIAPSRNFFPHWSQYEGYEGFFKGLIEKYSDSLFRVIPSYRKFIDVLDHSNNYGRNYKGCPGGLFTCAIGADAKVYYCCSQIGNPNFAIGDLHIESLLEIMNSKKRREIIEKCDFRSCQYLCRNHEINKTYLGMAKLDISDRLINFNRILLKSAPPHNNFL